MSRIAAIVLAILLVGTSMGASVTTTTQSTALNGDFVVTTMDDAGVYEELTERAREEIVEDLENASINRSDQLPDEVTVNQLNASQTAENAVTAQFISTRFEQKVRGMLAYLNGDNETINFSINVQPVKERVGDAIGDEAIDFEAADMIGLGADNMGDTEVPINERNARTMLESESGFQRVKEDFRQDIREETRRETGASGEQLDQAVEEALDEANTRTKNEIENTTREETSEYSDNITEASIQMQYAMVDALTEDNVDYDVFTSRVDEQEQVIRNEAGRLAVKQIDQRINNQLSLADYMGDDTEQQIRDAPGTVGMISTMSLVLTALSLLFVGLIYLATRSFRSTAFYTGVALLVSAGLGLIVGFLLRGTIVDTVNEGLPDGQPDAIGEAVLGLVRGVLAGLSSRALAMLVIGIVLVALAFADREGYLDGIKAEIDARL